MQGNKCPFCSGLLRRKRGFHKGAGADIGLYICAGCSSELLYPQPTDDELRAEYDDYYSKRTRYSSERYPKESFFSELLSENAKLLPARPGFKALELGSGGGDFIKAFNRAHGSSKITAVEMNRAGLERFKGLDCRIVESSIEDYLSNCKESYDIIFLFDVIEHLRDPIKEIRKAARILNPGGRIFLTAPLTGSFMHRASGRFWPQYKVEHLYYYSRESFYHIGKQAGLTVKECRALSKRLPLSYLLSVGSQFGPRFFSSAVNLAMKVLPSSLYSKPLRLSFGEAFVVYVKD